ncbi:MAG TPA: LbtU family siderophore porin [Chromatiales bacterium]|nr:LbtU family siderophore porin [Chromatiales bacterium]
MKKYNKQTMASALAIICGVGMPLMDAQADEAELKRELLNLKHKIERLEKSRRSADEEKAAEAGGIAFSGLVEVEAGYVDGPGGHESDLVVATVELGAEAQVTPWVNAHVLLLFEEDDTEPMEVDEAIITLANPEASPWSLAAGRMYVPFGNFESALVSDPLTLEIGETRETALQFGYGGESFQALAWLANGDTNDGGSEGIEQFGAQLGLAHEGGEGEIGYGVGLSWTNNIADSDSFQEAVADKDNLKDKVAGIGAHAVVNTGPFTFIGEYITASKSFDAADLAFGAGGAKPAAINLEFDYGFEIGGREAGVAIAWQKTKEALALELPETRVLAALSVGIYENTTLALEYAHDEDYDTSDGGSGEDADTLTAQLALEF